MGAYNLEPGTVYLDIYDEVNLVVQFSTGRKTAVCFASSLSTVLTAMPIVKRVLTKNEYEVI